MGKEYVILKQTEQTDTETDEMSMRIKFKKTLWYLIHSKQGEKLFVRYFKLQKQQEVKTQLIKMN